MTGAGSFRRWLGCAPTIVARVSHGSAAWEPAQRFLNNHRIDVGCSQPCSDLTSGAAHRAPRDLHLLDGREMEGTHPSDLTPIRGLTNWGSLENSLCRFACMRSLTGCA